VDDSSELRYIIQSMMHITYNLGIYNNYYINRNSKQFLLLIFLPNLFRTINKFKKYLIRYVNIIHVYIIMYRIY
jgi:hypothetical protein